MKVIAWIWKHHSSDDRSGRKPIAVGQTYLTEKKNMSYEVKTHSGKIQSPIVCLCSEGLLKSKDNLTKMSS